MMWLIYLWLRPMLGWTSSTGGETNVETRPTKKYAAESLDISSLVLFTE